MILFRLGLLFVIGLATWLLAFGRSAAWDAKHRGYLIGIVFADEVLGIGTGMYLARNGTWLEAIVCALGGTAAVWIVMRGIR